MDKKIFEQKNDGLVVRIKIIPNSSKNELIWENDAIKIKITAQPIENKANKALIEFFSKKLKIPKTSVTIIKGELNKEKTLLLIGMEEKIFREKFEI